MFGGVLRGFEEIILTMLESYSLRGKCLVVRVERVYMVGILVVDQICKYRIYPIMLCGRSFLNLDIYGYRPCDIGVGDDRCMISMSTQYKCLPKVKSKVSGV